MKVLVSGARVVAKDTHTFDNGDTIYRVNMGNGEGALCLVTCPKDIWETLVPYDEKYDCEIDVHSVGFKIYADMLTCFKQ